MFSNVLLGYYLQAAADRALKKWGWLKKLKQKQT